MVGAGGQLPDVGGVVPEVPGYRIERQLGRGSMGVVYLAEDLKLRRKVALKILAPTLADDELFRKRFDRESQSAANLDHPSIVPVYAAGEAGGSLYIAMRYVGGGDLRALLEANGPLGLGQATSIIASVADALDAAHAQGMVHRDVKPANILIDSRNGQQHYYLSDFGITKVVSSSRSLTSTGQIVGTVDYIAPEQIQGKPVDARADLYALGCVLYQCLTGNVPFPRDETAALMWAHVHDEPPPVTSRRPDLPPQIDGIVAKAMAKQPEDRFATCRELALALRTLAADPAAVDDSWQVVPAKPVDSPPPPLGSAGMTSTYTPPTPAPARPPKTAAASSRRRWWIAAASVLALALVGGLTVGVLNYLNSRFPNDAEQALLDQVVPLALQDSCTRNEEAERDFANVEASVACTSDGDAANKVVFTKFTSAQALDSRYRTAVASAPLGQSSGDCLSAERAEAAYASESGRTSGQALCYQQRGSSFVKWTDDKSHTLGVATRTDPDYVKLRDWWAGVVGLPTMAESEAAAQARKQVEEAQAQAKKQVEEAEKAKKQQEEEAARQVQAAQAQAEEVRKRQEEEAKRQVEAAQQQAAQAEEARKQQEEEASKQAEADQQQAETRSDRQQEQDSAEQSSNDDQSDQEGASQNRNDDQSDQGETSQDQEANKQAIEELVNDAIKRAIQQQQEGNASSQDIEQQIEDDIRKSIQQRVGDAEGQGIQELVDDAIKKAIQQAEQNQR